MKLKRGCKRGQKEIKAGMILQLKGNPKKEGVSVQTIAQKV